MHCLSHDKNGRRSGFTFVEILVTLLILGILAVVAIPVYINFTSSAEERAVDMVTGELNARERLSWGKLILSGYAWDDDAIFNLVEPQTIGNDFTWGSGPNASGGSILFRSSTVNLSRTSSNPERPGLWARLSGLGGYYVITLEDGFSLTNWGRLSGSYTGEANNVVIPSAINGINIREINQDAFRNKGMIGVGFDTNSQVQRIHARAFYDNNLTHIDFPDTVERIDLWSFRNNNLTEIKLPPNLHTIEQHAFNGNPLNKITIGSNVNNIGDNAFGSSTGQFKQAYETGGAGTYIWNGDTWVKQNS